MPSYPAQTLCVMTSICRSISLFTLLAIWSASSAFAQQRVADQEAISMELVSSDRAVMASAFEDYLNLPFEQRTPKLRAALVDALEIENERRRKYLMGEGPHWALGHDDAIGLTLAGEVMDMRDPAYVDVLLPWLCCGGTPRWIDLGKEAVPPVLQYVYSNEPLDDHSMHGGVSVLQMMVDHWGLDAFTPSEREQLREIVLRYISVNALSHPWYLFIPAVDLASAIGDTELLQMAEAIANDEDELRKRQITDPWEIDYLREVVSKAVSGTREPYRHAPYAQSERDVIDSAP